MSDKSQPAVKWRAYHTIAMYKTADGEVHATEAAAQEHAEDKAGKALFELLHDLDPNMGHGTAYKIVCHMLKKHEAYRDVLAGLHSFEPEEENHEIN